MEYKVLLQIPSAKRAVFYYGTSYYVPFPSIVFLFETGPRGNLTKSQCVAAGNISNNEFYHYPFGNVYDDYSICWGNVFLPQISEMRDFDKITTAFFTSDTNDDLWTAPISQNIKTQRNMLEELSKMDFFPKDWLRPCHFNAEI